MICGWCNSANVPDADFCKKCGKRVEGNAYKEFKKDAAYAVQRWRDLSRYVTAAVTASATAGVFWAVGDFGYLGWTVGCGIGTLIGYHICITKRSSRQLLIGMCMTWVMFTAFGACLNQMQVGDQPGPRWKAWSAQMDTFEKQHHCTFTEDTGLKCQKVPGGKALWNSGPADPQE